MIVYVIYLLSELPQFPVHNSPKKEIRIGGPCFVQNGKSSTTNTWLRQGRMVKAKNQTMKQILANTLGAYISWKTAASQSPNPSGFLQQTWSMNGNGIVTKMLDRLSALLERFWLGNMGSLKFAHHLGPPTRNTYEIIFCRILSG